MNIKPVMEWNTGRTHHTLFVDEGLLDDDVDELDEDDDDGED